MWMHLRMVESRVLFVGHCDHKVDSDLSFRIIMSRA